MKRKIMGLCIVVMLFVLLSPDLARVARAGGINSAEQKVLSAASGTFSYQGKTYVLKSQYIAEGRSKLSEDGIDLSDQEANSYVSQFHNSYAELVEGGYCDEVVGQDESQNSDKKDNSDKNSQTDNKTNNDNNTDTSNHTKAEKAKNELFLQTIFGDPKDDPEKNGESNSEADKQTASKDEDDADEWLEKEDRGITINFEDEDITAAKEQSLTISNSDNQYRIQPQDGQEPDVDKNILAGILHLDQWKILSYVIFGIAFCTVVGISCYIWKVQKRKHKKRKLRLGLAIAAGISVAGCAFLLMFVMGLYFGIYNKEAIHRQLMESDYYSGVTQMIKTLAEEKLQEAGGDTEIAADVFDLSHVYIEERQYIDAILSGKEDSKISVEVIENALMEQIPDDTVKDKTALIRELTDMYQNTLQFELGKIIRENQREFLPWCYAVAGISIVLLLLLFVLTYIMYAYLHKSVRVCAAGIFAASLIVTGIPLVMRFQNFAGRFQAEPVYYQQFIQKYVNWSVNVMIYVGCIGLLAAVALTVWKRYLHMIYAN